MNGEIPLDEVVTFDETTSSSTGAAVDADVTPSFAVYEDVTDTAIQSINFVKRTSLTGNYRGTFTVSAANGFEIGKWYNVISSATVGGIAGKKKSMTFRCIAAEVQIGYQKVDMQYVTGAIIDSGPADVNVESFTAGALTAAALNIDTGLKPVYTFLVQTVAGLTVTAPLGAHTTPQFYRWYRYKGIAADGAGQEGFIVDYTGGTTRQFTFDRAPVVPFVVGSTISIFSASATDVAAWRAGLVPAPSAAGEPRTELVRWVGDIPAGLTLTGLVTTNVDEIDGSTQSATRLARATQAITTVTVGIASTTTTVNTSAISPSSTVIDQFRGQIICFAHDTTTVNLRGQKGKITASSVAGAITVSPALTTAPVSGDTATIQ